MLNKFIFRKFKKNTSGWVHEGLKVRSNLLSINPGKEWSFQTRLFVKKRFLKLQSCFQILIYFNSKTKAWKSVKFTLNLVPQLIACFQTNTVEKVCKAFVAKWKQKISDFFRRNESKSHTIWNSFKEQEVIFICGFSICLAWNFPFHQIFVETWGSWVQGRTIFHRIQLLNSISHNTFWSLVEKSPFWKLLEN